MEAGGFTGADNQTEESQQKPGFSVILWIFVVMPLLYVLSIGPVFKIAVGNGGMRPAVGQFYYPVFWLHEHTLLRKPLEAYVALWGVK